MKTYIIQIIAAIAGTLGFCMFFNIPWKHIIYPALGGGLCWILFLLFRHWGYSIFPATFFTSVLIGLCGELIARIVRVPTTIFFMPACIPLIPGGNLYYALSALITQEWGKALENTRLLALYSVGIAAGLAVVLEADRIRCRLQAGKR